MGQDGLRVTHAELDRAAGELTTTFDRIEAALGDLEKTLDPLKQDWSGEAQRSYQVAKSTWNKEMDTMKDVLTQTATAVINAKEGYQGADKKGAGLFGG